MTNSEIVHIWAQNTSEIAKTGNGNLSTCDNVLFSYVTPVAKFFNDSTNPIAIWSTYDYSVTTKGKHLSHVPNAINHVESYTFSGEIEDLPDSWDQACPLLFMAQVKELEQAVDTLSRKRTNIDFWITVLQEDAHKLSIMYVNYQDLIPDFSQSTGLLNARLLSELANDTENTLERLQPTLKAKKQADKARALKAKKERVQANKERLQKWLNNEINTSLYNLPIYLRLSKDNSEIQTSQGASIPTTDAIKLWQNINDNINIEGMALGHFTVNSCANNILHVGCHKIPMDQLNLMAVKLGL